MSVRQVSKADIIEEFCGIVAQSLRLDRAEVTLDSYLDSDLGAESLDLLEITMEVEAKYNIWISEKSILDTAAELFGEGVMVQDGRLTEEGKRLLRMRIPARDAAMFGGEVALKDLQHYFLKVSTWAEMIHRLVEETPDSCPECKGDLEAMAGFRMKCKSCDHQFALPSGEEVNLKWVENYRDTVYLPSQAAKLGSSDRVSS